MTSIPKCSHPACSCAASDGRKILQSALREIGKNARVQTCQCGHPQCIAKATPPTAE